MTMGNFVLGLIQMITKFNNTYFHVTRFHGENTCLERNLTGVRIVGGGRV